MPDTSFKPTWGSRKMDEFVAWLTRPGEPSKAKVGAAPVNPDLARKHIQNVLKYIEWVDTLAKTGNTDAVNLMVTLGPLRPLLKAARTGTEIAAAAQASANHFASFMSQLEKRAGDKAVLAAGYRLDDKSMEASDARTLGEVAVARLIQHHSRRVIAYNNPDGTSIPQLMACKVERDFIHRLKFWEKTHELAYAPCDSVRYLLELGGK